MSETPNRGTRGASRARGRGTNGTIKTQITSSSKSDSLNHKSTGNIRGNRGKSRGRVRGLETDVEKLSIKQTPQSKTSVATAKLPEKSPEVKAESKDYLHIGSKQATGQPTVLMVAEKPSLAETISKILAKSHHTQVSTRKGATNVHEWTGSGKAINVAGDVKYRFTSVTGHVFGLDFDKPWQSWDKDPAQLFFEAKTLEIDSNPKQHMPKHLEREALGCQYLVLWLDCDNEGENIAFEVIKCVKHAMHKPTAKQNVYRAHFSSLTPDAIEKSFLNLGAPNQNLSFAVATRQEIDLKIGVAFTRFQTKFFQGKYGDLDATTISYGPCQSPTLGLVVKRHDEIMSFVPQPYYTLSAKVQHQGVELPVLAKHAKGRFKSQQQVLDLSKVLHGSPCKVTNVSIKAKTTPAPHAMNTLALLQSASKKLGMGPMDTMHIAERLYMRGIISYPRTETTKYPVGQSLSVLADLQRSGFDTNGIKQVPAGGKDVGDHPPITPMRSVARHELDEREWRLYELVVQGFLASLSPSMKWEKTSVKMQIGTEEFTLEGQRVLDAGWTRHYGKMIAKSNFLEDEEAGSDDDEADVSPSLPLLKVGDVFKVSNFVSKEQFTKPPGYLSESDLLALMDKYGIGTDASMATHVSNIVERKYVQVVAKRKLVPSKLGIVLIHGYQKIDADLCGIHLRSGMEKRLQEIALGKALAPDVLRQELSNYFAKYQAFTRRIVEMDGLFEASFTAIGNAGKSFSKCGACKRFMHLLPNGRLYCRTCDETYNLPRVLASGGIQLKGEDTCPIDGFQVVVWTTGPKSKAKVICPKCYNDPPAEFKVASPMPCSACPHSTCPLAVGQTMLFACHECDGSMILDSTAAPRFKVSCTNFECPIISVFSSIVADVKIGKNVCECGAKMVNLVMKDKSKKTVCVDCNDDDLETRVFKLERGRGGRGRSSRGRRGRRVKEDEGPLSASATGRVRTNHLSLGDFF
jgi:DNA topoisomerase-3